MEKKGKLKIAQGFYSDTFSIEIPKEKDLKSSHKILFIVKKNKSGDFELITKKTQLDLSSFSEKEKSILLNGNILYTPTKIFFIHKTMNTVFSIETILLKDILKNNPLKFQKNKRSKLTYTYNKVLSSAQIQDIAMGKNVTLEVNVFNDKNIFQGIITKTITADPSFFRGENSFNLKSVSLQKLNKKDERNDNV